MSCDLNRRPERRTRDGAVLLSRNHISLLQGLLDRPRGRAILDGHVRARVAGFGEYVPGRVHP